MSFPTDRLINFAPGLEVESAQMNAIQDAICWQSRCLPRSVGTIARDGTGALGSASVDYDPHLGAYAMTNGGTGIKWTQNGTEYWVRGSSAPGTPGGSESGYALKAGPGCLLIGHGTASGSTQRLWRSTDGGANWSSVAIYSDTYRPRFFRLSYYTWICEASGPASIGAAAPHLRSTDGGATFSGSIYFDSSHSGVRFVARSPLSSVVVAGVENSGGVINGVFVSVNDGITWAWAALPGSSVSLKSLGWSPRLGFFASGSRDGADSPWLWSSVDGATWIDAMGPILGTHGASWANWGSSGVVSCGHLLMGFSAQSSPSLNSVLFSLGGVGAPWFRAFAVGSSGPLMVQESWPTYAGGSNQRPMPFSPVFTGASGYDLSMIVAK